MIKDIKKARFKAKMKKKWICLRHFVIKNKGIIIGLAPIALTLLTVTIKNIGKHVNLKTQKNVKELYCYDPSLGHYWELKKKLKNSDWIQIQKRKDSGEKLGDILKSMNVLK